MLAGRRIADGKDYGDGGRRWKKGTLLYKVIWEGYPPDAATWEPPANISDALIDEYEASLDAEAEADLEEEEEEAELETEEAAAAEDATMDDATDGSAADGSTADGSAAADSDAEDDQVDADDDIQMDLQVAKINRHHVYGGSKAGSLFNIYVVVTYSDGSKTQGGFESAEPLALCESGRAALRAYVLAKGQGAKIAKYLPF